MSVNGALSPDDESFLVLSYKKEQRFFLKKEAKTFISFCARLPYLWASGPQP